MKRCLTSLLAILLALSVPTGAWADAGWSFYKTSQGKLQLFFLLKDLPEGGNFSFVCVSAAPDMVSVSADVSKDQLGYSGDVSRTKGTVLFKLGKLGKLFELPIKMKDFGTKIRFEPLGTQGVAPLIGKIHGFNQPLSGTFKRDGDTIATIPLAIDGNEREFRQFAESCNEGS